MVARSGAVSIDRFCIRLCSIRIWWQAASAEGLRMSIWSSLRCMHPMTIARSCRDTRRDQEVLFDLRLRVGREFGSQHLTRVEQDHGMQTAARRAIAHRVANDTDAVAGFKRILRPSETLQDGRAAGDDIPFNWSTAAIGLKHQRECRMRIAPMETLHGAFERACMSQFVCRVRVMRDGGQRHERCGTE
jgi:hypothetical protein